MNSSSLNTTLPMEDAPGNFITLSVGMLVFVIIASFCMGFVTYPNCVDLCDSYEKAKPRDAARERPPSAALANA